MKNILENGRQNAIFKQKWVFREKVVAGIAGILGPLPTQKRQKKRGVSNFSKFLFGPQFFLRRYLLFSKFLKALHSVGSGSLKDGTLFWKGPPLEDCHLNPRGKAQTRPQNRIVAPFPPKNEQKTHGRKTELPWL